MRKTLYWIGGIVLVLIIIGALSSTHNPSTVSSSNDSKSSTTQNTKPATQSQKPPAPTIVVKQETAATTVPFTSTTVNDSTLAKGQTKITQTGVNGTITTYYNVTYTNGVQTSKTQTNQTEINPVNQITAIGTYVAPITPSCTNGAYVNSAGNTACSPEASPSVPVGATAQCVDGTYSFSESRSGTCSHHGGVASWL